MEPITAFISLGSNLGDRAANIEQALQRMSDAQLQVLRVSSLIENPAVGMSIQSPSFLNAAAEITTRLTAEALMQRLLSVEQSLGRTRGRGWLPRTIDLDLLLYDAQEINSGELIVPHPRMHERSFVLGPLAEIAPQAIHPKLNLSIAALWQASRQN